MDRTLESTFYLRFTTRAFATGIPGTLGGTPVISAYEDNSITQITAGITLGVDHDSVTGLNLLTIVATAANGFEAGKDYDLVITTGTVGSVSVVGEVVGHFSLGLDASFVRIGAAGAGLTNINLPNQTMDITGDITGNLSGSVGSLTGHTPQTGNTFAQLPTNFSSLSISGAGLVDILQTAADKVWSSVTRLLTAGTNIILAKGVGLIGLNDLSAAQVNAEVDTALADYGANTVTPPTAIENRVEMDSSSTQFIAIVSTIDTLLEGLIMQVTTIATLASQTSFTLTNGSSDDNAYNEATIIIVNNTTSTQKAFGSFADYAGVSKTVTLAQDPAIFTMDVGDKVYIVPSDSFAILDALLSGLTHNVPSSLAKIVRQLQESGGYEGGFVWVDTVDGTGTGTVPFENGTITSKCITFANAIVVAGNAALNIKQFSISSDSIIILEATLSNRVIVGHGWELQLASQNIAGLHVIDAEISGICTGSDWEFHDSKVTILSADAGTLHNSYISGTMNFTEAGQYHIHNCHAGDGGIAPKFNVGAAVGDTILLIHSWHGKSALQNCGQVGNDEINLTGFGEMNIEASCIGGVINVQGSWAITGAAAFITAGGVINYDDNTANIVDIKAKTENLPEGIKKNTALAAFPFDMVLASDGITPAPGLTVTAQRSIDGGSYTTMTGTITEISDGSYAIALLAVDNNGDTIKYRFTAATALASIYSFKTSP